MGIINILGFSRRWHMSYGESEANPNPALASTLAYEVTVVTEEKDP